MEARTHSNDDGGKVVAPRRRSKSAAIFELTIRDGRENCLQLRYLHDLQYSVTFVNFLELWVCYACLRKAWSRAYVVEKYFGAVGVTLCRKAGGEGIWAVQINILKPTDCEL